MNEELMHFDLPQNKSSLIKVIGVGGGGGNAVNYMHIKGIRDVNFIVCNTDAQALTKSPVAVKIQLGKSLTEGRGAGNKPEIGREAAKENLNDVLEVLSHNTKMVFITAGMGGGTGTGGAPVIAKATKEQGILTIAIVTIPFRFEGNMRYNQALEGINELKEHVDSLLVINNEKLREIYGDLRLSDAFARADNVLASAAKGIAEIITVPGYVNVDFADVETVMANSGVSIMGTGMGEGENRSLDAIQQALSSPLLNDNDITGAQNILLNITSGKEEISMDEVGEITDFVNNSAAKTTNLIWGTCIDENLGSKVSVTIIATGFKASNIPELEIKRKHTAKVPLIDQKQNDDQKNSILNNIEDKEGVEMTDPEEYSVQRVIEFDLTSKDTKTNTYLQDKKKGNDILIKKDKDKKVAEPKKELQNDPNGYTLFSSIDNIDQLENEPAFVRKKRNIEEVKHSEDVNVSKYSLQEDEEKKTKLRSDNSYLHDNVD